MYTFVIRRVVLGCLLLILCAPAFAADPPAATPPAAGSAATFADQAKASGVEGILKNMYAHAAAWGDADGDGYPDLFWGAFGGQGPNRLLINNRDGTFRESVQKSVNRPQGRASGAVFVDLDNDGALDLVVIDNGGRGPVGNQLLHNDGQGNFTDVTAGSGLDVRLTGRNAFPIDYDGDGLIDLLVQDDQMGRHGSILLHNGGKMKFTDATSKAGLPTGNGALMGLGGAVGDINGDGWPDILFVGTKRDWHTARNSPSADVRLYLNNRKGGFVQAKSFDFSATFPGFNDAEDWICGAAIGDLNGDGKMDLVIGVHYGSSVEGKGHKAVSVRAFLNTGSDSGADPTWKDITQASGLTALFIKQPNVEIQDFNNDGKMDIWNGASMRDAASHQQMPYIQYNQGNDANGIPHFAPPPGLSAPETFEGYTPDHKSLINPRYFSASPTADYDLDGRLDIFGADWATPPVNNHSALFHNTMGNVGRYVDVKVDRGSGASNRFGVGAKVSIYVAGQAGDAKGLLGTQLIEIANGYAGGRPATAHFGVPNREQVDVVVQLPSGGPTFKVPGVSTNQILTVAK